MRLPGSRFGLVAIRSRQRHARREEIRLLRLHGSPGRLDAIATKRAHLGSTRVLNKWGTATSVRHGRS